eukprot:34890_1
MAKHTDVSVLIVNGFIRQSNELLPVSRSPYFNIPKAIIQLCFEYYFINEYWDILGKDTKISLDKTSLIKIQSGWDNTSYGKNTIPSIGNYIYKWKIKIDKLTNHGMYIGIASNHNETHLGFQDTFIDYNYVWDGGFGLCFCQSVVIEMSIPYDEDDIIYIQLNTQNGTLMFAVNDEQDKPFPIKQNENINYKLAVSMMNPNDCIIVDDFKITHAAK